MSSTEVDLVLCYGIFQPCIAFLDRLNDGERENAVLAMLDMFDDMSKMIIMKNLCVANTFWRQA